MQPRHPITTDLVLLGAGHAHVEVLRRFAMRPERGVRLTLIAREPETLRCGMLAGLIRGQYRFDEAHLDLAPLSVAAGARLIVAEATSIDLAARMVTLSGRPPVAFDLLSINVGGESATPDAGAIAVKPVGRFLERLAALEAAMGRSARVALVGGDAVGTELALALAHRFRGRFRLVLVCDTPEPVADAPAHARRVVRAALVNAGVELVSGVQAGALSEGRLPLSDSSFLEADAALWAVGVRGPKFLAASGLPCDAAGLLRVNARLRAVGHDFVFAAGDCAVLDARPTPKAEVWARRAGAPLAANLRRAAHGKAARPWRPWRDALATMNVGDGRAMAWRNGLAVSGRAVWRWRDWIDRRWMRRHTIATAPPADESTMRCDAKLSAEVLAGTLANAARLTTPNLLTGLDTRDIAAVLKPPPGQVLVQSVEWLRAFLDDPYVFGQIAAAHALSGLHAMGARPWTALVIAGIPCSLVAAKTHTEMSDMLGGAREVLSADSCTLIGGHSAVAAESSIGFALSGLADPRKLVRKSGLRIGDALVLTKPLGTGIVLAGHTRGAAHLRWLLDAIDGMRASNAAASRVLLGHGATACTDVAGFGLAGHLIDMLRASSVAAVLWPNAVPALPGALELAGVGIASPTPAQNSFALAGGEADPRLALLIDPQTSGGLLAGVPSRKAAVCLSALHDAGLRAAVIGEVEPAVAETPSLRLDDR
jgi:selenide, water dikinase